jgi:hypothetical protein
MVNETDEWKQNMSAYFPFFFFECIGYASSLKFSIDKRIVLRKFPMATIQSAQQKILIRHQKD